MKQHHYNTTITWTGNKGEGTTDARAYERSHTLQVENKPELLLSSDKPFRGDGTKHNPEDFLLAAVSSCHMLWYLHLCADAGVIVLDYRDKASATLEEQENGGGHFIEVVLHPEITLKEKAMLERAKAMHEAAHKKCFIANSCNFPVTHEPVFSILNEA